MAKIRWRFACYLLQGMEYTQKAYLILSAVVGAFVTSADAITFANGDFEGFTGDTNRHNGTVPPGWTTTDGTPDTFNASTDFSGYTWAPSNSGGQFLHGIGDQPDWTESAIQEAVGGLVIGNTYEISFEQSISRSEWSETGGYWSVKFGEEQHDSAHMEIPDFGEAYGWNWHTMFFTAAAETQRLEVIAMSDTDYLRTDIAIDGFYLGDPRSNPPGENLPPDDRPSVPSVPETGSTSLLLGLGGMGLLSLRKRLAQR